MNLLAFLDTRLVVTSALLAGALLLGAVIIGFVRRWQQLNSRGITANEQLAQYRALYDRGELSEDEFRRLRDLLTVQIRKESGLSTDKPPPAQAVTPAPAETPPPPEPPDEGIKSP
jgi:hypothetical protein